MCEEVGNTAGRKPKAQLIEGQVRGSKYLGNIMQLLKPLHGHKECHNRKLHYDEYMAYLRLYFFTPVLDSVRGLQQARNAGLPARAPAAIVALGPPTPASMVPLPPGVRTGAVFPCADS